MQLFSTPHHYFKDMSFKQPGGVRKGERNPHSKDRGGVGAFEGTGPAHRQTGGPIVPMTFPKRHNGRSLGCESDLGSESDTTTEEKGLGEIYWVFPS